MKSIRVLWMSRHKITPEQESSLREEILARELAEDVSEIVHLNLTFPAKGDEAATVIAETFREKGFGDDDVLVGVFPAHVAVALWHGRICNIALPVSVPAPAKEGEIRGEGFVHSHWEWF